jgi:two-component system chemotaxis sensor kinase CheA
MSIDVTQFHRVFFEESFEELDAMEMGLLGIHAGSPDMEIINTIIRAAHSIKGGTDTFGFAAVSEFIHGLETVLDQMRNGEVDVCSEAVDVLLQAVDVLREMLTAVQQSETINNARAAEVSTLFESLLASSVKQDIPPCETSMDSATSSIASGWLIDFKPHPHLLQTGNDPLRMFYALAELGDIRVTLNSTGLPAFSDLEPEESHLSWQIELHGAASLEQINEIFEWVEGDCVLTVSPLASAVTDPPAETDKTEVAFVSQPENSNEPVSATSKLDAAAAEPKKNVKTDASMASIRVSTDKIDSLINLMGELVITQSMVSQLGDNFEPSRLTQLMDGLEQLERNTRELQEGIMRICMLPISFAFNRFPRLVHDLSAKMGKQVELQLSGEQTELDKTVMEKISDPLVHLVRNSLNHGLETPEQRLAAGKPKIGLLHLNAYHQGGNVVIEISDDGAGLNEEKILQKAIDNGLVHEGDPLSVDKLHELIFLPGFSTADEVSDVSGRGAGMDVVRKNINSLGGRVEVSSERNVGATITICLPLTLAIVDGQTVQVGDQNYIIPLISIIESVEIKPGTVKNVTGKGEIYTLRDEYVPLIRLHDVFNIESGTDRLEEGLLVIVDCEGRKVGLFVDELLAQQQVVIKSLETNYRKVTGIAGATILKDGTVALILDIAGLHAIYRDPTLAKSLRSSQAA